MPDAVVDRLEVIDVEDDERELAVVAMGPRALADERLVEVAAVVETGQGVEVGELAGLPKAPRILDRGPGPGRELLESGELLVRRLALLAAPEGCEGGDGLSLGVAQRNRDPAADESLSSRISSCVYV
jgi:hypothetical protein